jgi:hypothetical protein
MPVDFLTLCSAPEEDLDADPDPCQGEPNEPAQKRPRTRGEVCAKAREAKAAKRLAALQEVQISAVHDVLESIATHSSLRFPGLKHARLICASTAKTSSKKRSSKTIKSLMCCPKLKAAYHNKSALALDERVKRIGRSRLCVPLRVLRDVALSPMLRDTDIAKSQAMHEKTVRRCRAVGAAAILQRQCGTIEDLLGHLEKMAASGRRLSYFYDTLMHDGTKQKLSLSFDPLLKPDQQVSTWDVLVARRVFTMGMSCRELAFELICPPVPCLGGDAGTLHAALHTVSSYTRKADELSKQVAALSDFVVHVRSSDAAKANIRLHAYESTTVLDAGASMAEWYCSIHQNHLAVGSVVRCLGQQLSMFCCALFFLSGCVACFLLIRSYRRGLNIISSMFSTSLLLRSGGYFMRLILCVRSLVESQAVPLSTPAEPRQLELCVRFLSALSTSPEQEHACEEAHGHAKLLAIFNGGMQQWCSKKGLAHYCPGRTCCTSWAESKRKMTEAIIQVLLRHRPGVPALARWTTIGPSLVFYLRLSMIHSLFTQLLSCAFDELRVHLTQASIDAAADLGVAHGDMESQAHWHAASGRRLSTATYFWNCQSTRCEILLLFLVLQPLFYCTHWLLKRSRPSGVPDGSISKPMPVILDWLCPSVSPVVAVLQYLCSMLFDSSCFAAQMISVACGRRHLQEVCKDQHQLLRIRAAILTASGQVFMRHWARGMQWPWALLTAADHRLSVAARTKIAEECKSSAACCLDAVAQAVQQKLQGLPGHALLQGEWQARLLGLARSVHVHTASVENKHARNKKHCHSDSTGWPSMCAKYIVAEAKHHLAEASPDAAHGKINSIDKPAAAALAAADKKSDMSVSKCVRSPIQLLHRDMASSQIFVLILTVSIMFSLGWLRLALCFCLAAQRATGR